ncbi:MAG: Hsp20/alpha crystallin family protein [Pseudomonadota bacterium]
MFGPGIWRLGRIADPLREMQRLQREMNRLFSGATELYAHDFPAVNVWRNEDGAIVTAELPGIDPAKLDISVVGDSLTLTGIREMEAIKEGESYHRQERTHGRFARTLQLPFQMDAAKVEAKYEKGVLQITLPRVETEKPKKIAIKVE